MAHVLRYISGSPLPSPGQRLETQGRRKVEAPTLMSLRLVTGGKVN